MNTVGFAALEATRKRGSILTPWGAANAWILGVLLWATLGGWGWGTCVLYLAAGSAVTKVKMEKKEVSTFGNKGDKSFDGAERVC